MGEGLLFLIYGFEKTGILLPDEDGNQSFGDNSPSGALPEIVHLFTKRDRTGFDGYKKQVATVESLKYEGGVIEKYFFISSLEHNFGMAELKQYIMDYPQSSYQ